MSAVVVSIICLIFWVSSPIKRSCRIVDVTERDGSMKSYRVYDVRIKGDYAMMYAEDGHRVVVKGFASLTVR